MVYLKSLYSRLDRIALRHSRRFSTEARSVHVKLLCRKISNNCVSKYRNEQYLPDLVEWCPCGPEKQCQLIVCKVYCLTCIY